VKGPFFFFWGGGGGKGRILHWLEYSTEGLDNFFMKLGKRFLVMLLYFSCYLQEFLFL
jgi:hypothetical protein